MIMVYYRWDSSTPHKTSNASKNVALFPDATIADAQNYCRNPIYPDEIATGPWCYTTDPASNWEYCDVPLCSG